MLRLTSGNIGRGLISGGSILRGLDTLSVLGRLLLGVRLVGGSSAWWRCTPIALGWFSPDADCLVSTMHLNYYCSRFGISVRHVASGSIDILISKPIPKGL